MGNNLDGEVVIVGWEAVCYGITEAEDKLPSLRLRKIRQLLKWLESIKPEYAAAEDISLVHIAEAKKFLGMEEWLREMQVEGEIE